MAKNTPETSNNINTPESKAEAEAKTTPETTPEAEAEKARQAKRQAMLALYTRSKVSKSETLKAGKLWLQYCKKSAGNTSKAEHLNLFTPDGTPEGTKHYLVLERECAEWLLEELEAGRAVGNAGTLPVLQKIVQAEAEAEAEAEKA